MKLYQLKETGFNPKDWIKQHYNSFAGSTAERYFVDDTIINDDGTVNYDSSLYLRDISRIEVEFNVVKGNFEVTTTSSSLTSLKNSPNEVYGTCRVRNQKITSLQYCPRWIKDNLDLGSNKIEKIDYFPEHVGGWINLAENNIKSLKGIQKMIKELKGKLYLGGNPMTRSIIGLTMIPGANKNTVLFGTLISYNLRDALDIMEPYYGKSKADVLECQEKMIDAGLDDYAEF